MKPTKMGKVISILDHKAEHLHKQLPSPAFDNVYDFLRAHYGESTDEKIIELLASLYRKMCELTGKQVDFSIMTANRKIRHELENF